MRNWRPINTTMKQVGYTLMQIAIYLMLLGGIGDLVYSFSVKSIIPAHLEYLQLTEDQVTPELRDLDLGLIRAIGGLLIALGIGALTLLYTAVKKQNSAALWGMALMVTLGEGNNALQMFLLDSPYYAAPLFFLLLFWTGVFLWLRRTHNHA